MAPAMIQLMISLAMCIMPAAISDATWNPLTTWPSLVLGAAGCGPPMGAAR